MLKLPLPDPCYLTSNLDSQQLSSGGTGIGIGAAAPIPVSLFVLQTFQRGHQRIHLGFSIVESQGRAHRCL